jgi:predicted signal transduction protein with EAL and GGDEF domain
MMRSRHFHRSLSVVIAQPASQNLEEVTPQLVAEIQQRTAQFYLKAQLAKLIGEQIRVVDIVMEDKENGRFIILCPEIDSQGSNLLTERIYKAVKDQANVDVSFGVASFPDQALTFESLLTRADDHLRQQQNQTSREIKIHPKQEVLPAQS